MSIKILIDGKESRDFANDFNNMIAASVIEIFYKMIGSDLKSQLENENAIIEFDTNTSQVTAQNISDELHEKIKAALSQS